MKIISQKDEIKKWQNKTRCKAWRELVIMNKVCNPLVRNDGVLGKRYGKADGQFGIRFFCNTGLTTTCICFRIVSRNEQSHGLTHNKLVVIVCFDIDVVVFGFDKSFINVLLQGLHRIKSRL